MKKNLILAAIIFFSSVYTQAQVRLGITAGMNMANEVSVFSNSALADIKSQSSLAGFTGGAMLEGIIPVIGLGAEVSALYSHRGSNFKYELNNATENYNVSLEGTKSMHCIDIPLNLKYKIGIPKVAKVFVVAGWYWSYAITGYVDVTNANNTQTNVTIPELEKETKMDFSKSYTSLDDGIDFGFGLEVLKRLQIGAYYYISLKNSSTENAVNDLLNENYKVNPGDFDISSKNRLFSIRATYLFKL